ncbi:voltage-gated chloride channel protein [Flavipsychrobacter stenotrophus]|uniref:Voltage-gated chloride channel protein n=1 Tax=Flavipsychrobacter stenotrophus TaxID=2077091 RepID=A0A2S7STV4_9BACT|nr:voltage-gated chloride channel family protein [Flavipsychrobacter stenotrophus]PQJ10051.1 voltage-gated chloride channel protein [Flavipsychrobacter stenotrophus]
MQQFKQFFKADLILRYLLKWTALAIPVTLVTGSIVAFFLWLLDGVTQYRWQHMWLLYLLPVAGVAIHFLYKVLGKDAERGNNLIIDEIHEPGGGVPLRMVPLVLLTTLITHLFGGSAGREGTAVQIGGSMAGGIGKLLKLSAADTHVVLMMGIAAGFGAVFGTPVAGAVFAIEVLVFSKLQFDALVPCLLAGFIGDIVCTAWGIHHTHYLVSFHSGSSVFLHVNTLLLVKAAIAGALFGLCAWLFIFLSNKVKSLSLKYIPVQWLIPVVGGCIIIGLTWLVGSTDYLGLGVTSQDLHGISIVNAFHGHGVTYWSWLWKLVFTVITLSMGFKGGEVTPLFFIGAALGNTLAVAMGVPADMFAALGFIAVFAGATNTPVACTLLGIELFGGEYSLYYAVACFAAFYCSGKGGIYHAQRR